MDYKLLSVSPVYVINAPLFFKTVVVVTQNLLLSPYETLFNDFWRHFCTFYKYFTLNSVTKKIIHRLCLL